jgi:predicted NAD-dependent protein-ADP-ribosyltransferase YbiA (DUF1768 family)
MAWHKRTYRVVDGERIEGTWRHVFINNGGTYFLADLLIYADGTVDAWEPLDFDGFCAKVRSGWVATSITPDARASAYNLAGWTMAEPWGTVTAEELIGEVRDEIARLRGEPTSQDRCLDAVRAYIAAPAPERLEELRAAYAAVPEHLRSYLLGDMDARDQPVITLLTPTGDQRPGYEDNPHDWSVTDEEKQEALDWLREWERDSALERRQRWTDPEHPPVQRPVISFASPGARVAGADPANGWLSPASPHPVTDGGARWPTALHAYWAASTSDPEVRARIRDCEQVSQLIDLMRDAPRREGWPELRLGEMARLLRLKFAQHPDLAERLIATGDAILQGHVVVGTTFWDARGQNWVGRLLEIIRSELRATT